MSYRISRNGEFFGPYSIEDIQRYVASGNIVLTDSAQAEGTETWIPVSQLLNENTAPLLAVPPAPAFPDPPNLHWALVLLLSVVSCGIFLPVWDLVIGSWLRKVEPASKALNWYIAQAAALVILYASDISVVLHILPSIAKLFTYVLWIVVTLVARFTARNEIEAHFNGEESIPLSLGGIMTFFFSSIYFQYHFNQIGKMKDAQRFGTPLA